MQPSFPSAALQAALALARSGRLAEATEAVATLAATHPDEVTLSGHLGLLLGAQQRWGDARAPLRRALAAQPDHLDLRLALVRCELESGDLAQAGTIANHDGVLADAGLTIEIARALLARGDADAELALLHALAERQPDNYAAMIELAAALHRRHRSSEALRWSERAAALRPRERQPVEMRAVALIDRGEVAAGLRLYDDLLRAAPDDAATAARRLVLLHYDPAQTCASLYAAHHDWARRHLRVVAPPLRAAGSRDPQRRLRVGWISPRFIGGPVASFLEGTLAAFDHVAFEHVAVPLQAHDDETSARLRAAFDAWLPLHGLGDAALLARLREAQFDIAIDLAGHATANRLAVLAQRVAPIQLCWLDWFDTTGAATIDGWISDRWLTPEGSPQRYSERVLRLDGGRLCYTPPPVDLDPGALHDGAPVFASFNRLAKLNDDVLDAWAAILRTRADARLALAGHPLDDAVARARLLERFAERGIGGERLSLHGQRPYADLLAAYRQVDVALDPFPFSGCTTSCDALWMGVPVLTLPGETFVSRQSASLLWRLGRETWVARDRDDYVARALALADAAPRLRTERQALRAAMRERLCDAQAHAIEFGRLLRALWQRHCAPMA